MTKGELWILWVFRFSIYFVGDYFWGIGNLIYYKIVFVNIRYIYIHCDHLFLNSLNLCHRIMMKNKCVGNKKY